MNPLDGGKQEIVAECPMAELWRLRDQAALHDAGQRLVCFPVRSATMRHRFRYRKRLSQRIKARLEALNKE